MLLEALPSEDRITARGLWVAGYLALGQTDPDAAEPLLSKSRDLATKVGDRESTAFATQYLGLCRLFAGDHHAAAELLEQAFEMHEQIEHPGAAFTLSDLAATEMLRGDLRRAIPLFERALTMTENNGDPWTRSHCFWGLGIATWLDGDTTRAEHAEKEALRLSGELDERSGIALSLEALAWMAASAGDFERSARLQGAALSVWRSIPRRLPEPLQKHAMRCERLTDRGIGRERRATLIAQGRRLHRAEAVALGLGKYESSRKTKPGKTGRAPLSKRELEVARLVAKGMTDREIAEGLVIAQRTAETHVQHILTKLGFRSRAQIAAWAATRNGAA